MLYTVIRNSGEMEIRDEYVGILFHWMIYMHWVWDAFSVALLILFYLLSHISLRRSCQFQRAFFKELAKTKWMKTFIKIAVCLTFGSCASSLSHGSFEQNLEKKSERLAFFHSPLLWRQLYIPCYTITCSYWQWKKVCYQWWLAMRAMVLIGPAVWNEQFILDDRGFGI